MVKPASSADGHGSRDTVFLLAVGIISLVCGIVSFYTWHAQRDFASSATASVEDDAPSAPLPAGPRKYQ